MKPPIPQTPRPKPSSDEGVRDRPAGRAPDRSRRVLARAPAPWAPPTAYAVAAPPVPWPKQSRARMLVRIRRRSRVLPELGERAAGVRDDAQVGAPSCSPRRTRERHDRRRRAPRRSAPSRNTSMTHLSHPFLEGRFGWPVDRSPGFRESAPRLPRDAVASPVARLASCASLLPGHSGGTAPASHRTSLDHRPYVGRAV